ncbi:MAG: gliding motility-associated ABC transporter ATP-binding subunit GldA [Bacteroidota bacterium]
MISVQNLTKIYGTQRAIDQLSFEAKKGEILGFLGPNGAGKSTTMKIVTGFLSPTEGHATVDGYDVAENPLEVKQKIGYLPEHNPLYLDMYVHESLKMVAEMYQVFPKSRAERKSRIAEVIAQTGLGREQHKKIGALSKGYRQRVGLAQALIHDPEVLILDEPTSGLDPNQIVDIRRLVKEVGADKTVIFSSHILSEVEAIADRVVIINRGKIVADQPIAQLPSMAEDEVQLIVEFEGEIIDTAELETWDHVKRIESPQESMLHIYTGPEVDIRKQLFELCVKQEKIMIGLQKHTFTLEDAFRKLTA